MCRVPSDFGDGAAVDVEDRSGDEGGVIGREERHRGGHVLGPTLSLQQLDALVVRPEEAVRPEHLVPARRHDPAGTHDVYTHAVLATATGKVNGKTFDAGLRRLVRRRRLEPAHLLEL